MYFENIIGQDFAKKYLTNSIKKNKLNNAYMFEGMDGIGKRNLLMSYQNYYLIMKISKIVQTMYS